MNRDTIFDLFAGTSDEFVADAIASRGAVHIRNKRSSRIFLVAAIIATLLLLAGCMAVFNWLNSRSIAKEEYTWNFDDQGQYKEPEQREAQIMTFYGDSSSPIQKAKKQWYEFEKTYDPDHKLVPPNGVDTGVPRRYETVYSCYTKEMADKIDEIARENGLKLLDEWVPFQDYQVDIAMEGAGITSILRPDAEAAITHMAGMLFPPQNLDAEFSMKLTGENATWTNEVIVGYAYARKDYLPDYGFYAWDTTGTQQWKYISSDGTKLLLALGKTGGGVIVAEQKDAYIIIDITEGFQNFPTPEEIMSKEALEQFADVFDYQLSPQVIDADAIWPKLDAAEEAYQAQQLAKMPTFQNFQDYMLRYGPYESDGYYAFYDLTGDGESELLLSSDGETFNRYVAMIDGKAVECAPSTDNEVAESIPSWTPVREYLVEGTPLGNLWDQMDSEISDEKLSQEYSALVKRRIDAGEPVTHYYIHDINADGVNDILLSMDGKSFYDSFTYRQGIIRRAGAWMTNLCQDNVCELIQQEMLGDYEEGINYRFWKFTDFNVRETLADITYNKATDKWTDNLSKTSLTETEAQAILAKYPKIDLDMHPIQELTAQ